jgi:hypothetical protein
MPTPLYCSPHETQRSRPTLNWRTARLQFGELHYSEALAAFSTSGGIRQKIDRVDGGWFSLESSVRSLIASICRSAKVVDEEDVGFSAGE